MEIVTCCRSLPVSPGKWGAEAIQPVKVSRSVCFNVGQTNPVVFEPPGNSNTSQLHIFEPPENSNTSQLHRFKEKGQLAMHCKCLSYSLHRIQSISFFNTN